MKVMKINDLCTLALSLLLPLLCGFGRGQTSWCGSCCFRLNKRSKFLKNGNFFVYFILSAMVLLQRIVLRTIAPNRKPIDSVHRRTGYHWYPSRQGNFFCDYTKGIMSRDCLSKWELILKINNICLPWWQNLHKISYSTSKIFIFTQGAPCV
jgi:hypothetical protein